MLFKRFYQMKASCFLLFETNVRLVLDQYSPSNPVYNHYTQVVWQNTTEIGCGLSPCNNIFDESSTFVTCLYSPPGNVVGLALWVPFIPADGLNADTHTAGRMFKSSFLLFLRPRAKDCECDTYFFSYKFWKFELSVTLTCLCSERRVLHAIFPDETSILLYYFLVSVYRGRVF